MLNSWFLLASITVWKTHDSYSQSRPTLLPTFQNSARMCVYVPPTHPHAEPNFCYTSESTAIILNAYSFFCTSYTNVTVPYAGQKQGNSPTHSEPHPAKRRLQSGT